MNPLRLFTAAPLLLVATLTGQDNRPMALVNARILTMTDQGTIESGTIVVRNGRIEAVGADLAVPPGARVVDVAGGTVMPGMVHAWSRAGLTEQRRGQPQPPRQFRGRSRSRGPSGGGGGGNAVVKAASKVADEIYARQDVFGELLRGGVTTLVVRPEATGFPGLAARLAPDAQTQDEITVSDDVYVVLDPAPSPKAGKTIKDALDKAKKALEERKKPKEEPKPAEAKPPEEKKPETGEKEESGKKEGEGSGEGKEEPAKEEKPEAPQEKKPDEQKKPPEPKKDPNIEVLADVLDGKRKVFLRVSSPMEIQHFRAAMGDFELPAVLVADRPNPRQGFLDYELEWLKKTASIVLTTPALQEIPNTRTLVNVPAKLHAAGLEVGFVLSDEADGLERLPFALMELVRCGLPADVALRAVTAVPAKALGLEDEVGSIAEGLRADLLVFSGDPLDPTARMRTVIFEGREMEASADR